jgi:hypothetical protein
MLTDVNGRELDDLQRALGGVVLEASAMERALMAAFAALLGSKYAPVVDDHLTAHNLIETCEHVARVHTDIDVTAKANLAEALRACNAANTKRNRAIHDAWALRPGGALITLQTSHGAEEVPVTARTLPELWQVADDLGKAANDLTAAVTAAFGADAMRVEDQLRLELGRDVSTDPGS